MEVVVRRVLLRGSQTIQLLPWHESLTVDAALEFSHPATALDFLRPFLDDPLSMMTLRAALAEELGSTDIAGLDDQEVLAELAWRLVWGHVKMVPFVTPRPAVQAGIAGRAIAPEVEPEGESAAPAAVERRTAWIAFELVDEEGNPVADESYRIVLPDGSIREGQLDVNGQARVEGIDPGTCEISFPNLSTDSGQPDRSGGQTNG
jgi:hypothetical protein